MVQEMDYYPSCFPDDDGDPYLSDEEEETGNFCTDSSLSAESSTLKGTIVKLIDGDKGHYGFIRPHHPLPHSPVGKDVFFTKSNVRGVELSLNDEVLFVLSDEKNWCRKPRVKHVYHINTLESDLPRVVKSAVERRNEWTSRSGVRSVPPLGAEQSQRPRREKSKGYCEGDEEEIKDCDKDRPVTKSPLTVRTFKDERLAQSVLRFSGELLSINENNGFIKPLESLPQGFRKDKNVFFYVDKLRYGFIVPEKGDIVNFTLDTKNPERPRGQHVRILKFSERPHRELLKSIKKLQKSLTVGNAHQSKGREELNQGNKLLGKQCEEQCSVLSVLTCRASWDCFCSNQNLSEKAIEAFINCVQLLRDRCYGLEQPYKELLACLAQTWFFETGRGAFKDYVTSSISLGNEENIANICEFLTICLKFVPEKSSVFIRHLKPIVQSRHCCRLLQSVYSMLECSQHARIGMDDVKWTQMSSLPTTKELLCGNEDFSLERVQVVGQYESVEEYFETYYRLLRRDCFDALSEGVQKFLEGKLDLRDMKVYHSVSVVGVNVGGSEGSLIMALKLVPLKKEVNWRYSQDLMSGNLLCLSISGNFKDAIWATVVNRDPELLSKRQIILVELCSEHNKLNDVEVLIALNKASGKIIMAESPTYYKAYQANLKALQQIIPTSLTFADVLVKLERPKRPDFITDETRVDASGVYKDIQGRNMHSPKDCSVREFLAPFTFKETDLDVSQLRALKEALGHRVAIVQGPPGTGKTFLGVKLLELLLSMTSLPPGPILLLTYKNHALDELLKNLLSKFPDDVVRIGGRSTEEAVENCNINVLRKTEAKSREMLDEIYFLETEQAQIEERIKEVLKTLSRESSLTEEVFIQSLQQEQLEVFQQRYEWEKRNSSSYTENETANQSSSLLSALKTWLPSKDVFDNLEKVYMSGRWKHIEKLLSQTKKMNEKKGKSSNEEEEEEDNDSIEKEEERKVMMDIGKKNIKHQDMISLSPEGGDSVFAKMPNLSPVAREMLHNVDDRSLEEANDLWALSQADRARLVQVWLLRHVKQLGETLEQLLMEYKSLQQSRATLENEHKANIIQKRRFVGMTITGASIYQQLLQQVQPPIVLVEEAAEVLEPQLLVALGPWVKQLILIGDHCQLRPQVNCYKLVTDYSFDVSMMERLIRNKMPYSTLQCQNRMRPEFAELLRDIYPFLMSNLVRVKKHKAPLCMKKSMFFWNHEEQETADRSYTNEAEADRALSLTMFLLYAGYRPSQITILAAYKGQTKLIRTIVEKARKEYPGLFPEVESEGVVVHTIDMYQGDENDILIVSLVRSNDKGAMGFLRTINRRCVAQSRAKCGMYFIGNFDTIFSAVVWKPMLNGLRKRECVGDAIEVMCPLHPMDSKIAAICAKDIPLQGFCKMPCAFKYSSCGHPCPRKCHPKHNHTRCEEMVLFTSCPCFHLNKRMCYVSPDDVKCKKAITLKIEKCGHVQQLECHQRDMGIPCTERCSQMKPCKHLCKEICSAKHDHNVCRERVSFTHLTCLHPDVKECSRDPGSVVCKKKVSAVFTKCGHGFSKVCYKEESSYVCAEDCTRKLPCKHPCPMKCGETCVPDSCLVCKKIKEEENRKRIEAEKKLILEAKAKALHELTKLQKAPMSKEPSFMTIDPKGHTAAEYLEIQDRVKKYVQPSHKWYPEVTKIEKVSNVVLLKKWYHVQSEMADPSRHELKFHGTDSSATYGICKEGFRMPSNPGMYGRGIYFATDSSKSAQTIYTKGSNMLLICDVLLGKSLTVTKSQNDMTGEKLFKKGYDSLFAPRGTREKGGVLYDEFVIFNPAQALPKYIVHYTTVEFGENLHTNDLEKNYLLSAHGGKTKKIELKESRTVTLSAEDIHYRIAESQFLRLQAISGQRVNGKITSVDYYINPLLVEKFRKMTKVMQGKYPNKKEAESILAFHGTKQENILKIVQENFKLEKLASNTGNKGFYGAGIYFSEFPSTSIGYAGGCKSLLLCRVLPGKSYNGGSLGAQLQPGYDSHIVGADVQGRGQELVIFNPDQILPCYVINYQ